MNRTYESQSWIVGTCPVGPFCVPPLNPALCHFFFLPLFRLGGYFLFFCCCSSKNKNHIFIGADVNEKNNSTSEENRWKLVVDAIKKSWTIPAGWALPLGIYVYVSLFRDSFEEIPLRLAELVRIQASASSIGELGAETEGWGAMGGRNRSKAQPAKDGKMCWKECNERKRGNDSQLENVEFQYLKFISFSNNLRFESPFLRMVKGLLPWWSSASSKIATFWKWIGRFVCEGISYLLPLFFPSFVHLKITLWELLRE